MKKYEKIKKIIEGSNGIITYQELIEKNISKYFIKKLVDNKILEKYSRGIYVRNDIFEDEFYIFQQKNKKVVFSYNTALYFLTTFE